jgi:hypothetical protein
MFAKNLLAQAVNRNAIIINKKFSVKFIPIKRLEFKEKGHNEKVCEVYAYEGKNNFPAKQIQLKFISFTCFSLFLFPQISGVYKLLTNLIIQPLLYRHHHKLLRSAGMDVVKVYLLKNGYQIIIETKDSALHLLDIEDIIKIEEVGDILQLEFFDKIFYVNLAKCGNINEDILQAIKLGQPVDVYKSYNNYNRFTISR